MTVWIFLIILNFVIPKKTFSEQENRYLQKVPEFRIKDLIAGEYSENLNSFINDHFVFRNFWLKLNSSIQLLTGKTENNGVYIGKNGYLFEKFSYTENEKDNVEKITKSINNFAQNVDKPIYFLLIPNSIYINSDKLPDNVEVANQKDIIDNFYRKLNSKITTIDVTNSLKENKNLNLYFKTDHHITSLGAYYVYKDFCSVANLQSVPISEFTEENVSNSFLGTFDSKAQVYNQMADVIDVYKNEVNQYIEGNYDGEEYNSIFNEKYLKQKDKYSYFLNGNHAKIVLKTSVNNGKKLLVIKDSYAHILSQFLCQNFEEVHFVDLRYYNASVSEYLEENDITDVLFLYNVSNLVSERTLRKVK